MKIGMSNFVNQKVTSTEIAETHTSALKNPITKVSVTPKGLSELPQKSTLPSDFGKGAIPGLGKNGHELGGLDKNGFGGVGKQGVPGLNGRGEGLLGGLGKSGIPGLGKEIFGNGIGGGELGSEEGMYGLFGGVGKKGPGIKAPGSDRMDGGPSGAIFGGGTWDFGPNGLHGSAHGGITFGGYGVGVNDHGQVGVAKGDHEGGSVTSPSDAQGAASSAISGGSSNKGSGVPEGLDWSRGTRTSKSDREILAPPADGSKKTEGPNDLGPSNNDPSTEEKKEDETAVAQNDTPKDNNAGKPNPDAMPNPEDTGGGSPRSNAARSSAYFMPNPEDSGGGSPRSRASALGDLFMPNPEDSGCGTPRSVIANIAMKLRG
jgi:hypothetical protein